MKAKKWLVIITFICSLLSLTAVFLFSKNKNIGYDLALAIFGSGILGFLMSITEYYSQRRKSMETFWNEAVSAMNVLRRVKYIDLDVPAYLVFSCFDEEQFNRSLRSNHMTEREEAKNNLVKWIVENDASIFGDGDSLQNRLKETYSMRISNYQKLFKEFYESCLNVEKVDFRQLSSAYGDLDFLMGNSRIRTSAYHHIYEKIKKYYILCTTRSNCFTQALKDDSDFPMAARFAIQICQAVFSEQISDLHGVKRRQVFQAEYDEIDKALEQFRCKIYFSKQEEQHPRIPVFTSSQLSSYSRMDDESLLSDKKENDTENRNIHKIEEKK